MYKRRSLVAYIELRLDQQYDYILNIIQDEFEMYDFQLVNKTMKSQSINV